MKQTKTNLECLHIGLRSAVVGAAHATRLVGTPTTANEFSEETPTKR
jgi:hypothetical protein